jgi:hypothetical protein
MQKQPSGDDVYLMLVTANVLRLRRQFELAEGQCSEVLRRDPTNAAAHSVLGDIARDRGSLKDAIEWYKMALDLNPGNVSDRKKLEAVIDRAYPREKVGPIEKLRENVAEQIMTSSAEMRAARLPLGVYIALGGMLAVIIGVTVIVLALGRRAGPTTMSVSAEQPPSGAFVSGPLEPKQTAKAAAGTEAHAEPAFAGEVAALEIGLLDRLRREARVIDPNCQVADAEIDPRTGAVSIRLSMPRVWSPDQTRRSILRVAAAIARAAVGWDQRVSAVRVRCDARQEGQPDERAFVGEADLTKLAAPATGLDEKEAAEVFPSLWWESKLGEGASAPTSPAPAPGAAR